MRSQRNGKGELICAVDLGGTHLRTATVDQSGDVHSRIKQTTPAADFAGQIIEAIVSAATQCREEASATGHSVKALSIVVPGTVNAEAGRAIKVPNVPCLDGFDVVEALACALHLPVILENDANAAALGELWRGAARGRRTIVCLTLGTGVGGGIILDGKLWRGANGYAGEIGHTCVEPRGMKCACGSRGCLEAYASATAVVRMANEAKPRYPASDLANETELSSEKIYRAGSQGDELAVEVFRQMGFYLGVAVANVINIFDPEMIVIGGGVANAWNLFEPHMMHEVSQRRFSPGVAARIVRAECGDDAGLLGAAYLWFSQTA